MYGTQAFGSKANDAFLFENDVKMYGTQATAVRPEPNSSLRMM